MSGVDSFFDTSVLLYLLSADPAKADRVEQLLENRGTISAQVLNEFAAVALRKLKMSVNEVREVLDGIRSVCSVEPVSVLTHERGLAIHERYRFSFYDSVLVATALIAGNKVLFSEDMEHAQLIDDQLRIVNLFGRR